jgi:FAD/FMN-containing dehydrogenase
MVATGDVSPGTRRQFLRRALVGGTALLGAVKAPLAWCVEQAGHLARFTGRIVRRGDSDYAQWWASMSWYLHMPPRYPDLIARARSDADVLAALAHAREKGLKVVVRSGGHNPARGVLRDGGMLLDVSRLRAVDIDVNNRTAWVEPGIHGEKLVKKLAAKGLDFPAAHTGIVPIGGYVMGGGLGWNMPERDIACRSILAAEVITADGRKLMVSAEENRDLWWALRGCGPGFFGVVTRYKLQCYPLYRAMTKSKYLFSMNKLDKICEGLGKVAANKKEQLEVLAVLGRFYPPGKPVEQRDLVCAISVFAFANSEGDAAKLMQPWTDTGLPAQSLLAQENVVMDYDALYAGQETDHSSPRRTEAENIWTDDIAAALKAMAQKMQDDPPASPRSFALSGWGFSNTREDDTSCVNTPAEHYLSWYQMADEDAHVAANRKWMDESVALMRPYTRGHYVNEINPLHYPEHLRECFTESSWKRLAKLRKKYDPNGLFYSWLGQGEIA